jgi:hypothetical protein
MNVFYIEVWLICGEVTSKPQLIPATQQQQLPYGPNLPLTITLYSAFDVITSLVSMEHGVYGCEKVTSLGEVTSNGLA